MNELPEGVVPSEKPLNVQVAEALGWRLFDPALPLWVGSIFDPPHDLRPPFQTTVGAYLGGWVGIPPNTPQSHFMPPEARETAGPGSGRRIPAFDTDWKETGPLIERLQISLVYAGCKLHAECLQLWCAYSADHLQDDCVDTRPLVAVCNLIVALHKEGKIL